MKDRSKRIPFRTIVSYNPGIEPNFSAFATNLSETGLHIGANNTFNPGTRIYMSIGFSNERYDCEGDVVWSSRQGDVTGMGIKFEHIPDGLLDIYKNRRD